jgi:hypothetical protein
MHFRQRLHHFTECFESQYYGEIHRYYEERSQANMKTADPPPYRRRSAVLS